KIVEGVSGLTDDDIYVAYDGNFRPDDSMEHWNGEAWAQEALPFGIQSFVTTSSSSSGQRFAITQRPDTINPNEIVLRAYHYDGAQWNETELARQVGYQNLAFQQLGDNSAIVLGGAGGAQTSWIFEEGDWDPLATVLPARVTDAWASDATHMYITTV